MRILLRLSIILILSFVSLGSVLAANTNTTATIFTLMGQKKWSQCEKLSAPNKALHKIVLSQKFLDINNKSNNFETIIRFLQQNPNWPQSHLIQIRAENFLNSKSDKKLIVDWFSKHAPITANGHKYYALAATEIYTDPVIIQSIIKNAWIFGNFIASEQKEYSQKLTKYLSAEDNIKKIDHLLWQEQITNAKNSLHLVNNEYQKSFQAQIAFMQGVNNALSLYKKVPEKYRTAGLVYQYINSQKKNPQSASDIVALIRSVKISKEQASKFWKLQSYIARELIAKKKYQDAYRVASSHVAMSASDLSDAEFLSGWLALSFLKQPDQAIKHFQKFNHAVSTPMSKSRGFYWLGRAYHASGNKEKSKQLYSLAATKYSYSFYGQMAAVELGHNKIYLPGNVPIEKYKNHEYLRTNDIAKAAVLVSRYGSKSLAEIYIKSAVNQTANTEQVLALAAGIASNKNLYHNTWMSKYAVHKHVFIRNYAYPTPYKLEKMPIEEPLTYSIIRQESVFNQHAISSADARGLMQLIKSTACNTAKMIGDKCKIDHLTTDPKYNLKLGSHYLNDMIREFKGSYILAIASYNGGPHNVKKWINLHGDPRKINNLHKVIDWLELIPYYETRNYVQRVLENLQVYRSIINKNINLELKKDLIGTRGV